MSVISIVITVCRTPPGVRELKLVSHHRERLHEGRTPPGVRELKLKKVLFPLIAFVVAPLPGCVN